MLNIINYHNFGTLLNLSFQEITETIHVRNEVVSIINICLQLSSKCVKKIIIDFETNFYLMKSVFIE